MKINDIRAVLNCLENTKGKNSELEGVMVLDVDGLYYDPDGKKDLVYYEVKDCRVYVDGINTNSAWQTDVATQLPQLISPEQVAEILGVSPGTLQVWRSTGRYNLPFIKCGGRAMYRLEDVQVFIERRTFSGSVKNS